LLSKVPTEPSCSSSTGTCTVSANNPNLVPETAFGYDLGFDLRLPYQSVVSVDGYMTNLYNHFITETVPVGTCGTAPYTQSSCTDTDPVFETLNTNLNNARFEGIELALRRVVPQGFGFNVAGAVQHAYAYNLPPGFYCAGLAKSVPCVPANYNVNLPIIAGENFTGNTFGTAEVMINGKLVTVGASGFSNTAIPYLQGVAEINYTTHSGIYAALGETLYGKNNGYNLPPFGIGYASIRVPINSTVSLQVSGDNIFNAWTGLYPVIGGGIAYPLANGRLGATIGNTVGPATYSFSLTKTFGGPPPNYGP
jgi:hypothetical protein